ncbi:MAG TPA: hypothetical protein VNO70_02115, partial [Blastocatellia bacterium]|nr:hypothetical protein [Blastocatellia bacterium]
IILKMRDRMNQMQREFENFLHYVRDNIGVEFAARDERAKSALVPRRKIHLVVKDGERVKDSASGE